MSQGRLEAAQTLRDQIQTAAVAKQLGVKILFVGLQDIHPPVKVAADYEKVVGAEQTKLAKILDAQAGRHPHQCAGGRAGRSPPPTSPSRRDVSSRFRRWPARHCSQTRSRHLRPRPPFTASAPISRLSPARRPMRANTFCSLTNTQDVVIFDLEDKIRADLINLNPNEKP